MPFFMNIPTTGTIHSYDTLSSKQAAKRLATWGSAYFYYGPVFTAHPSRRIDLSYEANPVYDTIGKYGIPYYPVFEFVFQVRVATPTWDYDWCHH